MDEGQGISRDVFDEVAYVEYYDDVRQALADGEIESGWWHYNHHGQAEGRRVFFIDGYFDEPFYLKAYPLARAELDAGAAKSAHDHYLRIGRARGYLPYYQALRPDNAAGLPSAFGGLWPDLANAGDIVEGKLEIGEITEGQASLLRQWIADGYVVLSQALPHTLIDAVVSDLDRAFAGEMPGLRFELRKKGVGLIEWEPEVRERAAKVLDLHHFSPATRALMFADPICEFLALIFESKAFASQTLGFLRGSGQEGHQDSAYVPFSITRQFAATWIALEDVTIGAGELFYYPGSHRFEDFLYGGRYKNIVEAERCGYTVEREEVKRHVARLEKAARRAGIEKTVLQAKKGDVLFWHADLVHGGNPVSAEATRKSLVTHYCPKRTSPRFTEHMSVELYARLRWRRGWRRQ